MDDKQINIKQFDLVTLKTTQNVKFLTAPDENEVSPHGMWSVIGIVNKTNVLVCKDGAVCLLPMDDIVLVAEYNINKMIEKDENGEEERK